MLKSSKFKKCFIYFLKRTPMTQLVSGAKRLINKIRQREVNFGLNWK